MKYLTVNQIRDKFLDFFIAKGHTFLPSFPLVPQDDNSLLLINAGMTPMKKFFTGQETPPSKRVVTCQKCVRTVDIDDVGKKARYVSFFEMLGNFSFGDYFKAEVIPWAWEFYTKELAIPVDKLYISVYEEDDDAYNIWHDKMGLPPERIVRLGREDNFWEHGAGPCGPCSEFYFDLGVEFGCDDPDCAVGCDCDRYMEIGNLVFIQSNKDESGNYTPMATTGIDVGLGLERIAMVLQGAASVYEIDNMKDIRNHVLQLAGRKSISGPLSISANIVADHVRAVSFMAADGIQPSNEGRGYVLRRMLRRAVRHAQALGLTGTFIASTAKKVIDTHSHAYPELLEKADHIQLQLAQEEKRFLETLDTGMNLLQKHIDALVKNGETVLSGADAFKLYDTFGFPPDLTREILEESGLSMDIDGFTAEMENQKNRARAARGASTYMGADETIYNKLPPGLPTKFCGYDTHTCEAKVLAILCNGELTNSVTTNDANGTPIAIVLDNTPFYATSGGQKADTGVIVTAGTDAALIEAAKMQIIIEDCQQVIGNNTAHMGLLKSGTVAVGQTVTATIAMTRRVFTMRNHSATHLLQKALREVLGGHVEQSGSEVGPDRLRFDFTHTAPLTPDERSQVEALVNDKILQGLPITVVETTPEEARKKGALALFGEKYGDTVRMVDMGGYSVELCGGTHVETTQAIGPFKLISESGIAAGVRRIEATTGNNALALYREASATVATAADMCKVNQADLLERLQTLLTENKQLKKEATRKSAEASKEQQETIAADLITNAETHNNFKLITTRLDGYDIEAMRQLCDQLRAKITSGCLLLCGVNTETGAAQFLASATDDAVKSGIHCGNLVKEAATYCGGGGGGRPNHAQAGGKDASKADAALMAGLAKMKEMLG